MNERQAEIMDYLYSHGWSTREQILSNMHLIYDKEELHNQLNHLRRRNWIKTRVKEDAIVFGRAKTLGKYAKPCEYSINMEINRKITPHDVKRHYGSYSHFVKRRYK